MTLLSWVASEFDTETWFWKMSETLTVEKAGKGEEKEQLTEKGSSARCSSVGILLLLSLGIRDSQDVFLHGTPLHEE